MLDDQSLRSVSKARKPKRLEDLVSIVGILEVVSSIAPDELPISSLMDVFSDTYKADKTMIYRHSEGAFAFPVVDPLGSISTGYNDRLEIVLELFNSRFWIYPDETGAQRRWEYRYLVTKQDGLDLAKYLIDHFYPDGSLSIDDSLISESLGRVDLMCSKHASQNSVSDELAANNWALTNEVESLRTALDSAKAEIEALRLASNDHRGAPEDMPGPLRDFVDRATMAISEFPKQFPDYARCFPNMQSKHSHTSIEGWLTDKEGLNLKCHEERVIRGIIRAIYEPTKD